jgi:hypothetical protein
VDCRSALFGSLAAVLCAAACVAALFVWPGGRLAANQAVILWGSTAVGLVTALMAPAAPRAPGVLARLWPLAVLAAGAAVFLAALAAPYPAARTAARDITYHRSRGCDDTLRDWPDSPSVADCRKLEWELYRAERDLRRIREQLADAGLSRPSDLQWVDWFLRRSLDDAGPEARVGVLPPVGAAQRRRIGERLRSRADDLVEAARETGVPALLEWAERVRHDVRRLSADRVGPS